jgi:hypothetical protein
MARSVPAGAAAETEALTLPPGGRGGDVMSPGLTPLPGGGFLLVWSEGPPSKRGVRAVALSPTGQIVGDAFDVSANGTNAGQPQAAVTSSGRGAVAFLESAEKSFRVVATAIDCSR